MDFRVARICDLSELSRLVKQLGYSVVSIKDLFTLYSEGPSMGLWVAEENGAIVGCLASHILQQFHGGSLFRIVSLVVDGPHRRRGVGRFLIGNAEREARKRGCEAIELTSPLRRQRDGSHDFYRRLGYLDSAIPVPPHGHPNAKRLKASQIETKEGVNIKFNINPFRCFDFRELLIRFSWVPLRWNGYICGKCYFRKALN